MVGTDEVRKIGEEHEAVLRSLLSPEESARYLRSMQTAKAMEQAYSFLLARALLRTTLSRYCSDVKPQEWNFIMNEHGKPEIDFDNLKARRIPEQFKSLRFNLSHCSGMVCCAVSIGRDVGVDSELISTKRRILSIAERFFSEAEFEELKKIHPDRQQLVFSRLWTLKEAYVKARGLGISGVGLDNFEFTEASGFIFSLQLSDNVCRFDREDSVVSSGDLWKFLIVNPPSVSQSTERNSPAHTVSLAVGGQEPFELVCLKTVPCHVTPDVLLDPRST
ncbi:hypothetical protein GUITHDRAFT_103549 [Guillardia theta CCMP2712]|uniref:holo-[acyl-carrier-protein] synthase n=1 Tax=Guillardia theta (strain CCMP2712) TaxID=905079 RepID=L1JR93_GUITC|nr:hypothetical protein GUITHDRAFT_103549 [Guillardia theta CCMP2712]EKX50967.1 hypothetical protein GUITHDRAFT_103549 [Guillardia theta CCMP2712]|eukprot:XP_005837947.1 hypothetical protein GUITHDRAFT_103549 [Guillardia theta CCMP2712]